MALVIALAVLAGALPAGATDQPDSGPIGPEHRQGAASRRVHGLLQMTPVGSLPAALRSPAPGTRGAGRTATSQPSPAGIAEGKKRDFRRSACLVEFPAELTVDCGVLTAPENRRKDNGRRVRLPVAIIRAQSTTPKPDPIVFITGGPAANEINPFLAEFLTSLPYAQDRDVILYNQRGVGFAEPRLGCPEFDTVRDAAFPLFPTPQQWLDAVRACRDRLVGEGIDLSAYNSAEDAGDLDDLRRALGYPRWNLHALSAGGVIALTAMRLHPKGIRSVILDSPVGNQFRLRGPDEWRGQNRTLEKVFAGCAADAACAAAYPNLRQRFYDRVHALRAHPVVIELPLAGGGTFTDTIDGDILLLDAASCAGVGPFCAPTLPEALDAVADGDIASFFVGDPIAPDPPLDTFLAEGKSAVMHCHDYIAFEPDAELRRAARELPEWRRHLLTLDFIYVPTLTKEACRIWRAGRAEPAQHQPVRSGIPTLVLTGDWDGIIWPQEGRRVARHLRNSYYYQFPGLTHDVFFAAADGIDCPVTIAAQFVDAPSIAPDAGCIQAMPELSFTPP